MEVTDFLIIGAGIAGLRAAIELSRAGRVVVLTKERLGESNTQYAQGGIAVALGGEQDVDLHRKDTVDAGDGLVDSIAAQVLVEDGPKRVEELLAWGANFDREDGRLMLTREGAHSLPRILHANGDATGREIARALLAKAGTIPNIDLREYTATVDLIVDDATEHDAVRGASVLRPDGTMAQIVAQSVLLACGGAGQVYSDTTNPPVATGDGIAMAVRAGVEVADMEFYQFHPTALSLPGVPRFLLSEALRGEGAYLRNAGMDRFMERYHPLLELAPRDVVARAITREGISADSREPLPVYLDMRHVTGLHLAERFPGISAFLGRYGLALDRDLIPIRPAAHYLMGGVRTDIHGRTSAPRLYAAGEVACTGVHGANRLASNSLLEGLVFGARAADAMLGDAFPLRTSLAGFHPEDFFATGKAPPASAWVDEMRRKLQTLMWRDAGLLRHADGLRAAAAELEEMRQHLPPDRTSILDRPTLELRNLHAVAGLILQSALGREESRGAHFRNDFPRRDDARFRRHSLLHGDRLRFTDLNATDFSPASASAPGKQPRRSPLPPE